MFNKISISTENWNKICEQAKKHSLKGSELLKAVFMKIKYIWGTDEYKSFFHHGVATDFLTIYPIRIV